MTSIVIVPTRAAEKYIRGIRNASKRSYAEAYYRWILHGCPGDGNGPEWDRATLSYMGAQAVRMNLDTIYSGNGR
jgi:hypothetical protein